MAISLKISNIFGNELELIQRLKKVNSPGKKVLLNGLATGDWNVVYKELLFRIELYAEAKVLNYTRQDLNTIVASTRKVGIDAIVGELVRKTLPVHIQEAIPQPVVDEEKQNIVNGIKKLVSDASYFQDFSTEEYSNELLFKSNISPIDDEPAGKIANKEANRLIGYMRYMFPSVVAWSEEVGEFVELHVDLTGETLRADLSN